MKINKIFLDLDSTLIYTAFDEPDQECINFNLNGDEYYTIVHPQALSIIDQCRITVGKDNIYILTAAISDYARTINRNAKFGFANDHILAREDIDNSYVQIGYGGKQVIPHKLADSANVLIDDLPYHDNYYKTAYMGITPDNYLNIYPYLGVNTSKALQLENKIKKFLK